MPRVSCMRCGKLFTLNPSSLRPKGNFCSRPCARIGQWPTMRERFEQKYIPEPNSGCWLWLGSASGKTLRAYLPKPGHRNTSLVAARVAWELYRGSIPSGMLVCHTCDNALCVNPEHLYLGTYSDNRADAVARGNWSIKYANGVAHGLAKLTDTEVLEIRSSTESSRSLAVLFGVHPTQIQRIRARKTWRHIP